MPPHVLLFPYFPWIGHWILSEGVNNNEAMRSNHHHSRLWCPRTEETEQLLWKCLRQDPPVCGLLGTLRLKGDLATFPTASYAKRSGTKGHQRRKPHIEESFQCSYLLTVMKYSGAEAQMEMVGGGGGSTVNWVILHRFRSPLAAFFECRV